MSVLTLRGPADIVAAVPYLIGFHPRDSVVVVAIHADEVVFACRLDVPPPPALAADTAHIAAVVAHHRPSAAAVLGYGTPAAVGPALEAVSSALAAHGIDVQAVLRVLDGRWWFHGDDPPGLPEGRPCEPAGAVAAAATFAGHVALPDRAALVAQVAAVTGEARAAMRRCTESARRRLEALAGSAVVASSSLPGPRRDPDATGGRIGVARAAVLRAGRAAVTAALRRAEAGGRLTDDEAAWLGVLLAHVPVRDLAWQAVDQQPWQVTLWTDLVRRVEPRWVPAPACLLAFAAWRTGQGALAAVAVERALAQDPGYSMAVLLDDILRFGLPPSAVDGWPAPVSPG